MMTLIRHHKLHFLLCSLSVLACCSVIVRLYIILSARNSLRSFSTQSFFLPSLLPFLSSLPFFLISFVCFLSPVILRLPSSNFYRFFIFFPSLPRALLLSPHFLSAVVVSCHGLTCWKGNKTHLVLFTYGEKNNCKNWKKKKEKKLNKVELQESRNKRR